MFILGLNLLPKEDRENKLRILNRDVILLKKSNAGAKATGKKFSFPENIKKNPKIIIKVIIKYFLCRLDNCFPKKIKIHSATIDNKIKSLIILN